MSSWRVRAIVVALWLHAALSGALTPSATLERSIHAPTAIAEVARPSSGLSEGRQQSTVDARGPRAAVHHGIVTPEATLRFDDTSVSLRGRDIAAIVARPRRLVFTHQATAPPATL